MTLPDVLLIDVPARFAHPSLLLGRYDPILVETGAERTELEAYLAAPRDAPVRPDLFDRRPSALRARNITFASYSPPESGWPYLLLCHWPETYTGLASDPAMFARGAYTSEAFETVEALSVACGRLLDSLGGETGVSVTMVPASPGAAGRA
ncbi:hypothetical protein M9978_17130 [Sphingomonas sp. MG17]|uniref:Uncharacterized protein n=1 Tax=Sphingomonas tagetis TaxID=2949092 RepID=A0A9X2KQU4_9SPHN|nr:hypothetical protein [Sphingomonas tagetis]MCP3732148.1 hypothetical protein [Sphingomonas tagetis]